MFETDTNAEEERGDSESCISTKKAQIKTNRQV